MQEQGEVVVGQSVVLTDEEQVAFARLFGSFPYSGGLGVASVRPKTIADALETVEMLSARVRLAAEKAETVRAEHEQLKNDVEGMRRVLGIES